MNPDENALGMLIASAMEASAKKPQKTSQRTVTTTMETPAELEDMRTRRDTIGAARTALADSMMARDNTRYRLGQALASIPATRSGGINWAAGLSGFGKAMNSGVDNDIDQKLQDYNNSRTDLADLLMYDKSMGTQNVQTEDQSVGYSGGGNGASGDGSIGTIQGQNFGRSKGYDPVANKLNFGPVARAAATGEQLGIGNWLTVPGSNSVAKGLQPTKSADLQTVYSDIADNLLSGKVLDYIGKVGSVRVADSNEEKKTIFGPLNDYQTMSDTQLNSAIKQARNNFVAAGMNKARQKGIPVTEEELVNHFNSAFTVPSGMQKSVEGSKNIQDVKAPAQKSNSGIQEGTIIKNASGARMILRNGQWQPM